MVFLAIKLTRYESDKIFRRIFTFVAIPSLVLPLSVDIAFACTAPRLGYGWSHDKLIERANTFVIAALVDQIEEGNTINYFLNPIEVLKGEAPETIEFRSHSKDYRGNDFDAHNEKEFWLLDAGRSEFPCCICGPDHTFKQGEKYILFPEAFGATKSAEIFRSYDDKWYLYVRARLLFPLSLIQRDDA